MSSPQAIYREPVLLDRTKHRGKRLKPSSNVAFAAPMNSVFVAVSEFPEVCKEFVIGFVDAGDVKDAAGRQEVSPIALLGLRDNENLFVDADGSWNGRYVPAFIRRYPLGYANTGEGQTSVMIDEAFEGLNDSEGELLVQDDGEATPFLQEVIKFLDNFELEVQRTRQLCQRIVELDLLKPVTIDITQPDGSQFSAGGVQMIDEAKLKALPEAVVVELTRNGALGLLHAHLISTTNVQRLTERLGTRMAKAAAPAA
ncbi:SapC family protein [Rivibacter subsaxonicus]|uniref:SapC protein n=1 Tax=Rivibacter subsaxonicus TaxID=457575 RepID=A0A4Q7W084_9BURK|nr:SapC family protein [Rivibacter subsaxonicus]RZU02490.1 SapC protein [Rivibacter subsaxonicus]